MTNTATYNTRNHHWVGDLPERYWDDPDFYRARHAHRCPHWFDVDVPPLAMGSENLSETVSVCCNNWTTGTGESWCPSCVTRARMNWAIAEGVKKNKMVASIHVPERVGKDLSGYRRYRK